MHELPLPSTSCSSCPLYLFHFHSHRSQCGSFWSRAIMRCVAAVSYVVCLIKQPAMDCGTFSTSILLRYLAIPIKVALVRVCMKYGSWQLVSELPETSQQGRINIWTLFTGEKKLSLYHRAERYETSVEKLQWLPIRKPGESGRNGCIIIRVLCDLCFRLQCLRISLHSWECKHVQGTGFRFRFRVC